MASESSNLIISGPRQLAVRPKMLLFMTAQRDLSAAVRQLGLTAVEGHDSFDMYLEADGVLERADGSTPYQLFSYRPDYKHTVSFATTPELNDKQAVSRFIVNEFNLRPDEMMFTNENGYDVTPYAIEPVLPILYRLTEAGASSKLLDREFQLEYFEEINRFEKSTGTRNLLAAELFSALFVASRQNERDRRSLKIAVDQARMQMFKAEMPVNLQNLFSSPGEAKGLRSILVSLSLLTTGLGVTSAFGGAALGGATLAAFLLGFDQFMEWCRRELLHKSNTPGDDGNPSNEEDNF